MEIFGWFCSYLIWSWLEKVWLAVGRVQCLCNCLWLRHLWAIIRSNVLTLIIREPNMLYVIAVQWASFAGISPRCYRRERRTWTNDTEKQQHVKLLCGEDLNAHFIKRLGVLKRYLHFWTMPKYFELAKIYATSSVIIFHSFLQIWIIL